MKRIAIVFFSSLLISSCSLLTNISWDTEELTKASMAALTSASITDAQVVALSQKTVQEMDAQNTVDNGAYQQRLNKLMADVKEINGMPINCKVYKLNEVNAFACGDGSIRVYSGLMDVMDDAQLMAIIGHECGHVEHQDSKKAMKKAYLASAARGVINAAGGTVGTLSKSVLGDLGESFVASQFSQQQEYKADDYGFDFAVKQGYSPYSMYEALAVLEKISGSSQASLVQKMFASHPGTPERAKKMKEKADALSAKSTSQTESKQ